VGGLLDGTGRQVLKGKVKTGLHELDLHCCHYVMQDGDVVEFRFNVRKARLPGGALEWEG
jgi:hypothetical protein